MTSEWGQGKYYNASCPENDEYDYVGSSYDGHAPAGCIAVALAQILRTNAYPAAGFGSREYTHTTYGVLSADFTGVYHWDSMPDELNSDNSHVAGLICDLGIAVEMDYGDKRGEGSGVRTTLAASRSRRALVENFGYNDATIEYKIRHTDSEWNELIKKEIDRGTPVYYQGAGTGGHAFVVDGYEDDYFHINWGWNGVYQDTHYSFDALTPGSYAFSDNQQAIIGIAPPPEKDACEDNDSFTKSYDLGELSSSTAVASLNIMANDSDWFRFTTIQKGTSSDHVRIDFLHSQGNLDIELYRPISSSFAERVSFSDSNSSNVELVSLNNLPAGSYYVRVYGYAGATNPRYTLTINPPDDSRRQSGNLSIREQRWKETSGDGDGTLIFGESGGVKIRLKADKEVWHVVGQLFSTSSAVDLQDEQLEYGFFEAGTSKTAGYHGLSVNAGNVSVPFRLHLTYVCDGSLCEQDITFSHTFLSSAPPLEFIVTSEQWQVQNGNDFNGDGVLQSGEDADVRFRLKNVGAATAYDVEVKLDPDSVTAEGVTVEDTPFRNLPADNLASGATGWTDFEWGVHPDLNFSGTFFVDALVIHSGIDEGSAIRIEDAVEVTVAPQGIFYIADAGLDFGVIGKDADIELAVPPIWNRGASELVVTGVGVQNLPSGLSVGFREGFPWVISPGATLTPTAHVQAAGFTGQVDPIVTMQFELDPSLTCSFHHGDAQLHGQYAVSGFVAEYDAPELTALPANPTGSCPDVAGNLIVWQDDRNGNWDIYAYNLDTGQETRITDDVADQKNPRVSGALIAWEDHRNVSGDDENIDIYGYDLEAEHEFVVSNNSATEHIVGADSDVVVFTRAYYEFSEDVSSSWKKLYNLHKYVHGNRGSISGITAYTAGGQHSTKYGVDKWSASCDFGGGTLAWYEKCIVWDSEDGRWESRSASASIRKIQLLPGKDPVDGSPVLVASCSSEACWEPRTCDGRVLFYRTDSTFDRQQVFRWENGSVTQLTPVPSGLKSEVDAMAIAGDRVCYWKDNKTSSSALDYLVCHDLRTGSEYPVALVKAAGYPGYNMDGNTIVFSRGDTGEIVYACLRVGFIPRIDIENPLEDETVQHGVQDYTVSGTSSDSDGVVSRIEYRVDDGSWQLAAGTSNWTFSLPSLEVGTHTIAVRAWDDDENPSELTTRTIRRNQIPELELSDVGTEIVLRADVSTVVLAGIASDADGKAIEVEFRLSGSDRDRDQSWYEATGTAEWVFGVEELPVGTVTLEVRARDNDDDYSESLSITVTREDMPAVPENVSASDEIVGSVLVQWSSAAFATHYKVFRATEVDGAKTEMSNWQTELSFSDTSAVAGTTHYYWVKAAADSEGDLASDFGGPDSGRAEILDETLPSVSVACQPAAPVEGQAVTLSVTASDNQKLAAVTIHWNDGEDHSHSVDDIGQATHDRDQVIDALSAGQSLLYWAEARDAQNNRQESESRTVVIGVESVQRPDLPQGRISPRANQTTQYVAVGAVTSIGSDVEYRFSWGDGNESTWGNGSAEHSWGGDGEYSVRARARSVLNPHRVSDWSDELAVTVFTPTLNTHWSFDSESDPGRDESGAENHATVNGAASVAGLAEHALSFDGIDDYVSLPVDYAYFGENGRQGTISMWFCMETSPQTWYHLIQKDSTGWNNDFAVRVLSSNHIVFLNERDSAGFQYQSSTAVLNSVWNHLAIVWDGAGMRMYINGVEDAGGSTGDQLKCTMESVLFFDLGGDHFNDQDYFRGTIDEVKLDSAALTAEQIALQDADGDNLPDLWEVEFFGNMAEAGDGDYDGDGESNKDEYDSGTAPNDAVSVADAAHAYSAFQFEICRGADQDAQGGLAPAFWEIRIECKPKADEALLSGTLEKPDSGTGDLTVNLASNGDALVFEKQDYGSLADLMDDCPSGDYVFSLETAQDRTAGLLRFIVTVPAYAEADFPSYVGIEYPIPGSADAPAAPELDFDSPDWAHLAILDVDSQIRYSHERDAGDVPADKHQVPTENSLTSEDAYSIAVTRNDQGNSWLASVTRAEFTPDMTPPAVAITRTPDVAASVGNYTLAIDGGDGVSVEFQLDQNPFEPYAGEVVVDHEGAHSILARSTDQAGNVGTAGPVTFTIDRTPPVVTIHRSPDVDVSHTSFQIAVDGDDGILVEYSLDEGSYQTYTGAFAVTAGGIHSVRARSTDAVGNAADAVPVVFAIGGAAATGDTDGDGIPDYWEMKHGFSLDQGGDSGADGDGDGLTNLDEYELGSDPAESDSDGDGMEDGWEVVNGFDPIDGTDADGDADDDGKTNLEEHDAGSDPWARPLSSGWNLISVTSEAVLKRSRTVMGHAWYWDEGSYCSLETSHSGKAILRPWRGYWIYVKADCEFNIRTGQFTLNAE